MATWHEFTQQAPGLAAHVFDRFEAHRHKTMATIRADGGPRISGTEVAIQGGQMYLGGMVGSRRFADLRRDPRIAIHSASEDPDVWSGDAKVSGRGVEIADDAGKAAFRADAGELPPGDFELFRIELDEAVSVRLNEARDGLIVGMWRDGGEVRTFHRQ